MKFHTFHPHVEFIKTNQATGAIFQTQSYFNPSFIFISMADLIYSMSPYLAKNNSTFPRLLSHQIHISFTSEKNLRSSLPNDIPNIELESNVIFKQKSLVQTCYYSPLSNTLKISEGSFITVAILVTQRGENIFFSRSLLQEPNPSSSCRQVRPTYTRSKLTITSFVPLLSVFLPIALLQNVDKKACSRLINHGRVRIMGEISG